jgi:Na+-transporting methylmalonyl-CoA/oxaloacetate decarboxylase gamma subunit
MAGSFIFCVSDWWISTFLAFLFILMIVIHIVGGFVEAFKWLRKIFKSFVFSSKTVDEKNSPLKDKQED